MTRGVSGFMKGIGMGIAVGCIAGAVGNSYMHSNKKGIKKNVGKALRNVGDLMDNVTSMFWKPRDGEQIPCPVFFL